MFPIKLTSAFGSIFKNKTTFLIMFSSSCVTECILKVMSHNLSIFVQNGDHLTVNFYLADKSSLYFLLG